MTDSKRDAEPGVPTVATRLSPMQLVVWNVAGAVEIVGICSFISTKGDMSDPVVMAIATVASLLVVWLTRKWILSRLPDATIERFRRRRP
ncbi:MAG: hypothetical protein ABI831_25240 [Betaproteobacteria bacterium]